MKTNIQLDPKKLFCDFESIQQRKPEVGYTLSTEYRLIKNTQFIMFQSLSTVEAPDVDKFVPLSIAVEHIESKVSHEYETNKITGTLVRQLRKIISDRENENAVTYKDNSSDENVVYGNWGPCRD